MTTLTTRRCHRCKREVAIKDGKVVIHLAKPGKPALGACPTSDLSTILVFGSR